jgi:hypothetical protein
MVRSTYSGNSREMRYPITLVFPLKTSPTLSPKLRSHLLRSSQRLPNRRRTQPNPKRHSRSSSLLRKERNQEGEGGLTASGAATSSAPDSSRAFFRNDTGASGRWNHPCCTHHRINSLEKKQAKTKLPRRSDQLAASYLNFETLLGLVAFFSCERGHSRRTLSSFLSCHLLFIICATKCIGDDAQRSSSKIKGLPTEKNKSEVSR